MGKLQYFESNAKRTQICQDVHGYAQSVRVENLLPLKTLVPIKDNLDNSTKCSSPMPPTPKPKFPFINAIITSIMGFLRKLFRN